MIIIVRWGKKIKKKPAQTLSGGFQQEHLSEASDLMSLPTLAQSFFCLFESPHSIMPVMRPCHPTENGLPFSEEEKSRF